MATNEDYARLMKDLLVEVPGLLSSGAEAALFATVRDFLQKTNVWQQDFDFTTLQNVRTYVLVPGTGQRVMRLMKVFNSEDVTRQWVMPATMFAPPTLILQYAPPAGALWVAACSMYVVDLNDDESGPYPVVPGYILNQYHDELFHGTLGRLMLQGSKPWSNSQAGLFHTRLYNSARAMAHAQVQRQNTDSTQAWSYPQGSMGRRQRGI